MYVVTHTHTHAHPPTHTPTHMHTHMNTSTHKLHTPTHTHTHPQTRRIISDFAVLISVIVWVSINQLAAVPNIPELNVPDVLQDGLFTDRNRSLIVNPFGNGLQGWAVPAAIIPALLATVLLFMDQQITALIVNRKDHKLKVGTVSSFAVMVLLWACGTKNKVH